VLFSDTVGFIKKLPHQLVESFKSTLEEVAQANLLLHVADIADPHLDEHIAQTRQVLAEIGAEKIPYLMVYNKIDANPEFVVNNGHGEKMFFISARENRGLPALQAELISRSSKPGSESYSF
jgi:GTP-binding protein HflX